MPNRNTIFQIFSHRTLQPLLHFTYVAGCGRFFYSLSQMYSTQQWYSIPNRKLTVQFMMGIQFASGMCLLHINPREWCIIIPGLSTEYSNKMYWQYCVEIYRRSLFVCFELLGSSAVRLGGSVLHFFSPGMSVSHENT